MPTVRRPRYADIASTLALVIAMGGTAYATATVGTSDIKNGAVTNPKLHDAAVTNPKLHDGAVTTSKLHAGAVGTDALADGSVTNAELAPGAVTDTTLADGAVTNFKLGSGVVTHSKLGASAIDSSNVAAESLTLSDLLGANKTGAITFSRSAGTCGDLTLGVSGAQVGQVVLFSFIGNTAIPGSVVFGGIRVTAANTIVVRACNVGATNVSVSNLGIRVVTFG